MRRAEINTEWSTVASGISHWGYRNWDYRTPIDESTYVSPAIGTPIPTTVPITIDLEYYDIDRGRTTVQIGDHTYLFILIHDVGRYFLMEWDIYADDMIYRWLEEFAPDPKGIAHLWTPTPANPFLKYEKRYETVWDKKQAEHILECYNNAPGVFRIGSCIILSTRQYNELEELNAILPRYSYMTNNTIGSNGVADLIEAIKKKSKKEMGYFV